MLYNFLLLWGAVVAVDIGCPVLPQDPKHANLLPEILCECVKLLFFMIRSIVRGLIEDITNLTQELSHWVELLPDFKLVQHVLNLVVNWILNNWILGQLIQKSLTLWEHKRVRQLNVFILWLKICRHQIFTVMLAYFFTLNPSDLLRIVFN